MFEIAEAWFFVIASICLSSVGYSNCQIIIPWSSLGMQVGLSRSPHIGEKMAYLWTIPLAYLAFAVASL